MQEKGQKKNYKGIILSGGVGTRLLPITTVTSKQLLPIYDKPLIYYPLTALMMAGVTEYIIISTPIDVDRFQDLFGDGSQLGIQMNYGVQETPLGIAHALLEAESFVGKDSVALVLGDNLFCGESVEEMLGTIDLPNRGATVFAYEVSHPERYGVFQLFFINKALAISNLFWTSNESIFYVLCLLNIVSSF